MDSKQPEIIYSMSKSWEDRLKPIESDMTGLKTYISRQPQDCTMSDEEALAAAPKSNKPAKLTAKEIGKWHHQARIMEEQLYEVHMFIGKFLYDTRKRLAKTSRHHKGKTFDKWIEENKDVLGMSRATVFRYIDGNGTKKS